jgi:hypothetical protein
MDEMTAGIMHRRWLVTGLVAGATMSIVVAPDDAGAKAPNDPFTSADRTFINSVNSNVRYALPATVVAEASAGHARTRTIGTEIKQQDLRLARSCKAAAARLGVALREAPTADERVALERVSHSSGDNLDITYVRDLWASDRTLLPLAAGTRVGTRNSAVRRLSQDVLDVVNAQLRLLESTGLVDYSGSASARPQQSGARPAGLGPSVDPGRVDEVRKGTLKLSPGVPIMIGVLGCAAIAIVVICLRLFRSNTRRGAWGRGHRTRRRRG